MVDVNIRIKGGLGNQLFIYAAGLCLAEHHNGKLKIDAKTGFMRDKYARKFDLKQFGFVENQEIQSFWLSILKLIDYKLCIKHRKSIFNFSADQNLEAIRDSVVDTTCPSYNLYLDGYFQDVNWVLPVLTSLRRRYEAISSFLNFHKTRNDENEVKIAVHIRDYELNYSAGLSRYYQKAIEYFNKKSIRVEFFVFSETPLNEVIKEIFAPTNYRILQPTDEDFFRMGQFDGIITANSTYSWWVAALAYDTDGMVVMPGTKVVSKFGSWDPNLLKLPGAHLIAFD